MTVDLDIGFCASPGELFTHSVGLARGSYGAPVELERRARSEVESLGKLPSWRSTLLQRSRREQIADSKFLRAGRAVHGPV